MSQGKRNPWLTYVLLLFGSFIAYEAISFQAAAIPSISKFFKVSVAAAALIQVSFYLGCTIFMPLLGRISDVYGRRRMLLIGMSAFVLSEFLAALSPNYPVFLLARLIQGLASAIIIPIPISYAHLLFPGQGKGKALGLYSVFSSAGAVIGAFLSGVMVDKFGWSSIYWFSASIGLIGIIIISTLIPETEKHEKVPYDFAGAIALFIGIGCVLVLPNIISAFKLNSPLVLVAVIGAVLGLAAFWIIEGKVTYPVVEMGVLKRREFLIPALVITLAIVVMNGSVYMLSFFIQRALGLGATGTGSVLMFLYLATGTGAFLGGWLTEKISPKYVINGGLVLAIIGVGLFSRINLTSPRWYLIISVVILGFGVIGLLPAINKTALSVMHGKNVSAGAGAMAMMKELGSPLGTAFSLTVFSTQTVVQTNNVIFTKLREAKLPENFITMVQQMKPGTKADPSLLTELSARGISLKDFLKAANAEGMVQSMHTVSLILLGLAVVVLLISFTIPAVKAYNVVEEKKETPGDLTVAGQMEL